MLLVGLTGGLASGKSTVARMFADCGATVIDADRLARIVVQPGKAAWKDIVKTFGRKVLAPDRTVDRQVLAEIVFTHPQKLRQLTRFIHPRVAKEQARLTRTLTQQDPNAVIIYDAALLIEAGAHHRMDRVIVVTATQATQIARACRRNGLTKTQALQRIRQQLPLAQKRRGADYVVNGMLPRPDLKKMVKRLYLEFTALAQTPRDTLNTAS